jgi:hypothetical protein
MFQLNSLRREDELLPCLDIKLSTSLKVLWPRAYELAVHNPTNQQEHPQQDSHE